MNAILKIIDTAAIVVGCAAVLGAFCGLLYAAVFILPAAAWQGFAIVALILCAARAIIYFGD